MSESLRISEIFSSIQGEGIWMGIPSTFVRVSGCNLRCVWCDTPYASWNPEGPVMSVATVVEKVEILNNRHVVLTGGEPMLFDSIETLAKSLDERGHIITIETAGTIHRTLPCHLMSISPKLANSTPPETSGWATRHEQTRTNLGALRGLLANYNCQLKFVVNPDIEGDPEEIDLLLQNLPTIEPDRILLMAEGVSSDVQRARQQQLVKTCVERGWRLAPRLHIDLFGNTKGT